MIRIPHHDVQVAMVRSLAALGLMVLHVAIASAQLPAAKLHTVFPAGAKAGTSVDVTITGADLDDAGAFLFPREGITAQPKLSTPTEFYPQARPLPGQFTVTVAADVPPGRYDLRVVGKYGVTNPRSFVIDTLDEAVEIEPNNSVEMSQEIAIPSVVNGRADSEAKDYFRFRGLNGQRLLIECAAAAIDSRMEAVIALYDASGHLVKRGRPSQRDPLLDVTLPADGPYFIQVHDIIFAGGEQYPYRLTLSTRPHIDFATPSTADPAAGITIFGRNLPGSVPAGLTIGDASLEKLEVPVASNVLATAAVKSLPMTPAAAGIESKEVRLATPTGLSNPLRLLTSSAPVILEQEPQAKASPQKLTTPCEVAGQFNPRSDMDWFSFDAKQGEVLWIEVFSQRLGMPTDPYLYVARAEKNAEGIETLVDITALDDASATARISRPNPSFDTATADPSFRLAVPTDGTYRVLVKDLYAPSRGSPDLTYRLSIRPESPDFHLVVVPETTSVDANYIGIGSPLLRRGGSLALKVIAYRQHGFAGEIAITTEGLPAGVTAAYSRIPAGADTGLIILSATEDAAAWTGSVQILGSATIGAQQVVRPAKSGTLLWDVANRTVEVPKSRTMQNLTLAVSGTETAVAAVAVAEAKTWETSLAGKLEIPVKITRRGDFKGVVKLSVPYPPAGLKITAPDIAAEASDGKLILELQAGATVGNHLLHIQADSQANYARNPEGAAVVAELSKHVETLAAQLAAAVQASSAAVTAADAAIPPANAELTTATEQFAAAKAAADAKPDNASLVAAKTATEAALVEKTAKQKAAVDAKATADAALVTATEKSKAAEAEKAAAAKRAADAAEAAKPKPLNVSFHAAPLTLNVTPAPIAFASPIAATVVKAGEKVSIPVALNRLYGYAEPVSLAVEVPAGLAGVTSAAVQVPGNAGQANLTIEATPQAAVGEHTLKLKAKLALNGQNLQVDQTFTIAVQAP